MKVQKYRYSQLLVLICAILALPLTSCSVSLLPQSTQQPITTSPSTADPASPETMATAIIEMIASSAPNKEFPISPDEFLKSYKENFMAVGWTPTKVLDYTDESTKIPELSAMAKTRINIVSVKSNTIEVHEFEWNDDPNVVRTDDPNQKTKRLDFSESVGIWLLTSTNGYFRISATDLYSYIETDYGKLTVWNYTIKDGKIITLVEQYVS